MFKKGKDFVSGIALERIYRLFEVAEEFHKKKKSGFAKRCIEVAIALGTRNKVKIPKELKTKFCKKCHSFLVNGKNADVKIEGNLARIKCKGCGFERMTKVS